ncbi:MAG: hypothetical protein SOY30_06605 [Eubacteriales bacterium]|nr:hypothetical protein [Eubacteriales bacterium]
MKKLLPGRLAHTFAILLTFLMTLTVFAAPLAWQGVRLLTDEALHESVALDSAVNDAQMVRITNMVEDLAAEQAFDPATVLALVTPEAVRAYNAEVVHWWMCLLQPDPVLTAPEWDADAIQDAVREDPLFQEAVSSTLRRATARDKVAYPIADGIQSTVLPIRDQLVTLAMPKVLEKVSEKVDLYSLLDLAAKAPLALMGVSALLALLVLALMHRRLCKGGMYIGSALSAAGLLTLITMGAFALLNPCAMIAQASSLLALQAGLLLKKLALPLVIIAVAELAVGLVLIAVHQRRLTRLASRSLAA